MKNSIVIFTIIVIFSCSKTTEYNIRKYFDHINEAELQICQENFIQALYNYNVAFQQIDKPFGKDLFNAALCAQFSSEMTHRNKYLQDLVDNMDDYEFIKSTFVGTYLSLEEWELLLANRRIQYDPELRSEFTEIQKRDQLYRPMYNTHDDTINRNRIINLNRILEITNSTGFPSHIELGYTTYLRGQQHDIVLHHTAQRRSRDKSVMDLEVILFEAIKKGRFDPESAIQYMSYQNDLEKGRFEVYATWRYIHPLLPDSLINKIWLPRLSEEQKIDINKRRKEWFANTIDAIARKTEFLASANPPFIFTSVHRNVGYLRDDLDKDEAIEQYNIPTSGMEEYKKKTRTN